MPDASDETDKPAEGPARATSRLAIAAVATGALSFALSCCGAGFAGALSVLLGTIALERIRASRGSLRGRGLAWAGIALGTLAFALSAALVWAVGEMQERWDAQLDRGLRATFAAHARDDATRGPAIDAWTATSGGAIEEEQLAAFSAEIAARYGELESFRILSEERDPDFSRGTQRLMLAVAFDFTEGRRNGAVTAQLVPSTLGIVPELRIESVKILDVERGDVAIPSEVPSENPSEVPPSP